MLLSIGIDGIRFSDEQIAVGHPLIAFSDADTQAVAVRVQHRVPVSGRVEPVIDSLLGNVSSGCASEGCDIILGHVDVSTTEIYARADTEMKRKVIEASCEDILPAEDFQDWNESSNIMSFLNSLC